MAKFSHLKHMTSQQGASKAGKDSTTFDHYVGGLGADVKQTICNKQEDNYAKTKKNRTY